MLCDRCESASVRAQESSQEVDRLSAEVEHSRLQHPCVPNHFLRLSVSQGIRASSRSWLRCPCSWQQKGSGQTSSVASSWSCSLEVRKSPCLPWHASLAVLGLLQPFNSCSDVFTYAHLHSPTDRTFTNCLRCRMLQCASQHQGP